VNLTNIVNQIFLDTDDWYEEMEAELDLFKNLFLGLVEIAAINSINTNEFKNLKKQETYLISSASWHDSEYSMVFNSKVPNTYELMLSKEYKEVAEPKVLEDGYHAFFGEKYKVTTSCIRGNSSREGVMPEEIGLFQNVEELEATNEYLKILPESLTWLNLDSNKLNQLPKAIIKLKNLNTLVLSNNLFDVFPEEILKLKSLKSIDLGGNPIEDLPKDLLSLPNLKELRVMPNKFSIEKRKELRETFGDILFLGYDSSANSFM